MTTYILELFPGFYYNVCVKEHYQTLLTRFSLKFTQKDESTPYSLLAWPPIKIDFRQYIFVDISFFPTIQWCIFLKKPKVDGPILTPSEQEIIKTLKYLFRENVP